jgi:hypothetical protein
VYNHYKQNKRQSGKEGKCMQKYFLDILKATGVCTVSSIKILKIAAVSQTEIIHRTIKKEDSHYSAIKEKMKESIC